MTRSRTLAAFLLMLVLALRTQSVSAADRIGVFFDAAGSMRVIYSPGFAVWTAYVLLLEPTATPQSFELSLVMPSGWSIISIEYGSGCVGIPPADPYDFEVGTCVSCDDPTPSSVSLVRINFGWFAGPVAPNDAEICLGPYSATSFLPPTPGYRSCSGADVALQYVDELPFCPVERPALSGGCARINPSCSIGTEDASWSALKAIY